MLDPFVMCIALPKPVWQQLRPYRYFAHNGLFENSLLRHLLLAAGGFPSRRHPRHVSGLDAATSFLANEQTVMIFPEGRRTQQKGSARSGVSVLSSLPKVGVIPVRIEWRKGRFGRRSFQLVVGRPIHESGLSADAVMDHIYALPFKK
jgi:1-acyl-sn-glycerol-3-phosphate acyltransferase